METIVRVSAGNYAQEMAASFGKIETSVIVNKEKLLDMMGTDRKHNIELQARAFAKLLQERGKLDCNVIFYNQDQRSPTDSRSHLVVQFILDIPLPSPDSIRDSIRVRK